MSRDFVCSLDEQGQKQLHKILGMMLQKLVLPTQCLTALVALLPKSATAYRPIALLHMLYRWYMKLVRPSIASWDRDNAGPWDTAVAGQGLVFLWLVCFEPFPKKTTAEEADIMGAMYKLQPLCGEEQRV